LPITTDAIRRAAEFWADIRRRGRPTAHQRTLDADAILAGQAATLTRKNANCSHLQRRTFGPVCARPKLA
jgi:hypothetical protein